MSPIKILSRETVLSGFPQVDDVVMAVEGGPEVRRRLVERGDSVAVLIFLRDNGTFLMVRQLRIGGLRHGHPYLVEIPAGRIDAGETPEAAARREVEEELGFRVRALVPMGSMLPSPGASSERIWLFRAEVEAADRTSEGGGVEDENLQVVEISPAEALAKLQRGELLDAKTQIAILRADFVD